MRGFLGWVAVSLLLAAAPALLVPDATAQLREQPEDVLRFGLSAFRDRLYEPAADALARYLRMRPDGKNGASARFFLAEALRRSRGRDKDAAVAYRDFLARYPDDKRVNEARFRLGEVLERLGDKVAAVSAYESVARGAFYVEALYRTASLRLQAREWKAALDVLGMFLKVAPGDRRTPEVLASRARALDLLGKREAAAAAYDKVLSAAPDVPGARDMRRRLAFLLLDLRRFDGAEKTFEALVRRFKDEGRNPEVMIGLAQSRLGAAHYRKAAAAFEEARKLPLKPEQRKAVDDGAAEAWWRAGEYAQAVEAYRRKLRAAKPAAKPEGAVLSRFVASLRRSGGCVPEKRASLEFALGVLKARADLSSADRFELGQCLANAGMKQEASARFREVNRAEQDSVVGIWSRLRLAELEEAAGHDAEAAALYAEAAAQFHESPGTESDLSQAVHQGALRGAAIFFERKQCPEALGLLKQVPRESLPDGVRSEVASLRAECAMRAGELADAEVYFNQVLLGARRPELAARARYRLAEIAERRGDKKDALRRLQEALPLLPADLQREARLKAGNLLLEMGRHKEAREMFLVFARDAHADADRRRRVWLLLGRSAAAQQEWTAAEAAFLNWQALSPDEPADGLRIWAVVRYRSGACPGAIEIARLALKAGQDAAGRVELNRLLASCLLREKHYGQAASALEELLRLAPKDAEAAFTLARTRESENQPNEAMKAYAAFLERFPEHARAPEAAMRLGDLYAEAGRKADALAAYRIASRSKRPDVSAPARYHLARALEEEGRVDEALAAYELLASEEFAGTRWGRAAGWRAAALHEKRGEWREALELYRPLARLPAGSGDDAKELAAEARQAEARARRLDEYLAAVREREHKLESREPMVR